MCFRALKERRSDTSVARWCHQCQVLTNSVGDKLIYQVVHGLNEDDPELDIYISWQKKHLKKQVVLAVEVIVLISKETRSFQGNRLPNGFKPRRDVESGLQPEPWGQLSPGWGGDLTFRERKGGGETWLLKSSVTFVLGRMWQVRQVLFSPASEIRWCLTVTDGRD